LAYAQYLSSVIPSRPTSARTRSTSSSSFNVSFVLARPTFFLYGIA
jgi:hypothetical protein